MAPPIRSLRRAFFVEEYMLVISNKASDTLKEFLVNEGIAFLLSKDNPHLDPRIADHPDLSLLSLIHI